MGWLLSLLCRLQRSYGSIFFFFFFFLMEVSHFDLLRSKPGLTTLTPCSHLMRIMYLFYCVQNGKQIIETEQRERMLHAIDFGMVYKQWALQHEKTCVPTCQTYGHDKKTMIKCSGCQNSYHWKCLQKETRITKEQIEKQNNKLICNIGQPCLYLRNQQFIKIG